MVLIQMLFYPDCVLYRGSLVDLCLEVYLLAVYNLSLCLQIREGFARYLQLCESEQCGINLFGEG